MGGFKIGDKVRLRIGDKVRYAGEKTQDVLVVYAHGKWLWVLYDGDRSPRRKLAESYELTEAS